jgi:hypothetical protein
VPIDVKIVIFQDPPLEENVGWYELRLFLEPEIQEALQRGNEIAWAGVLSVCDKLVRQEASS